MFLMAPKSAFTRGHAFSQVVRLVLTLFIFLSLFVLVQGSADSQDDSNLDKPSMGAAVSEYLFTGKENTTDTCAPSDNEAILGTLQRRDTRYFGLMDDRCYKSDTCEKKNDNSCRLGYKKVGFEFCGVSISLFGPCLIGCDHSQLYH